MPNRLSLLASSLAAWLVAASPALSDTVLLHNVVGYTPSETGITSFSGLVIVDGRVQRLLPPQQATSQLPSLPDATRIDGAGKTVLPGLIDAHGHVLNLGQQRLQVELRGTASLSVALQQIAKFAAERPTAAWILGRGWNQVLWQPQQFPTARDLDSVVADRPALLTRVDGHAIWVNSAALRVAGVTRATPDPAGGQIVRDAAGNPTGVLIDAATTLIERHLPKPSDGDIKLALATALRELAGLGLTGVHDAGIDLQQYRAYQQLGASGELPVRVYAMLADSEAARATIAAGVRPLQFADRLQLRAVKVWVDGALGSRGAAMLADYSDQSGHRGLALYSRDQLQTLAQLTAQHGWQLNVHAIGDAGNRTALDVFASLDDARRRALRPRIEHAQVVAHADIARFASLGVIASIQPTHATSDMNMAENRIGAERIKGAYAWRQLLSAGAKLAGGSDFPVELPNPFHGLYAAVTRQDRAGAPADGWYSAERLTREEALRLFTLDAAYAGHMEQQTGSLAPGKWADFIVLDRDYFRVPAGQIDDIEVLATYIAGKKAR